VIPARTIPIVQVQPKLGDAVRMAVGEIARFLGMFYPPEAIARTRSAEAVAGQWLSRIKGFHADDDFLHLTRDFLAFALGSGAGGSGRIQAADPLAYYFSGFMPSYGAACILLAMAAEKQPWSHLQAFMHGLSYGNARAYVESFDWGGGQKKAQAEIDAWQGILQRQANELEIAADGLDSWANEPPLVLAFAPDGDPLAPRSDVPPQYRTPPKPPTVPVPIEPAPPLRAPSPAPGVGATLLRAPWLILLLPLMLSGDTPQPKEEPGRIVVPLDKTDADAAVNTTNNDCKPQSDENRKNGTECEEDGYVLMEQALQYARLVDPPKGKGLDGLFEKRAPFDQPNPMPTTVEIPKPGKLLFIPPADRPPQPRYDFTGNPPKSTHPKFVVFEAKHMARTFDANDTEGIKKEAKYRLKNTCDGQQMGVKWTDGRIPQALERQHPGAKNRVLREGKRIEIQIARYARWIFVCLPGPIESKTKLYVFIDVVSAEMDLDSMVPKPRAGKSPSSSDSTY
jgi:hypothetical protein